MASSYQLGSMCIAFLILCSLASQAMSRTLHAVSMTKRHKQWMARYGRVYKNSEEKDKRFQIFKENVEFIESFNSIGNQTYKLSINEFADQTNEEFKATTNGYKMSSQPKSMKASTFRYGNVTAVPSSMDWTNKGAVTPIKSQGQCGSCWAFSTVAAMEGIIQLKTGKLNSFSEQELVDCDTKGRNQGCHGGYPDEAFVFIQHNGGLATQANYPYKGIDGNCKTKKAAANINGHEKVPVNNEKALLKAVANQPVSVLVNAKGYGFQFYSTGVFTGSCDTNLDHAVTAIGYGTADDGTKYWLVKNSWGTGWGEKGYMEIQRDIDNEKGLCGIAMEAYYPTV